MVSKSIKLHSVSVEVAADTAKKRVARKAKQAQRAPHKALENLWYEVMIATHGRDVPHRFGAAEKQLAKTMVEEMEFDLLKERLLYFVHEWCPRNEKMPSFRLFWALRAQIHGEVIGTVKKKLTREERRSAALDMGEFDQESSDKEPDIGWG